MLANLPGGTRPDLARAERIQAQLSLPALLHRRIEVSKLTLEGPNILFEFVGGKPNWILEPAADSQTSLSGVHVTLDIRQAHVRNGMVTVRLPTRTHVVGIRSLDLRHAATEAPLDLAAVLVYSDYQPFNLQALARPTGGVADPWDTRLEFEAYKATISAGGRMSIAGDYDLQVEGRIPELEKLNALLPSLHLPTLHRMSVSTHLISGRMPGDLPNRFLAWGTIPLPMGFQIAPILEARRAEPKDDLISALGAAEIDGEKLADEEIFSFLRLLLPAGVETTYRSLGSLLLGLLSVPSLAPLLS